MDAWQLRCVREGYLSERKTFKVRSPADAAKCLPTELPLVEAFFVLTLSAKQFLLYCHCTATGLLDSAEVHPREVFRSAIMDNASAIVILHNHPSGDATPSTNDIRITKMLVEAGRVIGINVLDHVIVGKPSEQNPGGFVSLRESGLIQFNVT